MILKSCAVFPYNSYVVKWIFQDTSHILCPMKVWNSWSSIQPSCSMTHAKFRFFLQVPTKWIKLSQESAVLTVKWIINYTIKYGTRKRYTIWDVELCEKKIYAIEAILPLQYYIENRFLRLGNSNFLKFLLGGFRVCWIRISRWNFRFWSLESASSYT